MVHLMIELARGDQSELAPYIASLPATFSTPLFFNQSELELLRGTALYEATRATQQVTTENPPKGGEC